MKIASEKKMSSETKRYLIILGIVLAFMVVFSFTINNFAHIMTVTNLIRQATVFTILSVGMTMIIIVGGIDLSVGTNIALSGAIAAIVINLVGPETPMGAIAGIITTFIVSTAIGAVNGYLCGYLEISAFITTLAMQYLCRGLTLLVTNSARIVVSNPFYTWLGGSQWKVGGVTIPCLIVALIPFIIISLWCVNHLRFGVKLYAVGGNPRAAHAAGIDSKRFIFSTYVITGILCGLATIITIGRSSSAQPLAGEGLEFTVITAVVLGGTSLLGGVGTIAGTFFGCLLMAVITQGTNMINIPAFWNYIIKGACVLVAVLADQMVNSAGTGLFAGKKVKGQPVAANNTKALENIKTRPTHVLELENISKSFSGVPALKNVSIKLESGRVHAIMGENGAGKSTLIKILSGVYKRDSGVIKIDGTPVEIHSTVDSQKLGISVIYQEFALIPELTITQNIFLGKEPRKGGVFLDVGKMKKLANGLIKKLNFAASTERKVRTLSVSQQQMVEIAKAMGADSWVTIMDEPTSAITDVDKDELFKVIREMKAAGMAIVYVSHRMAEIFEICDDVTVLRDGELVASMPVSETNEQQLTQMMVGRDIGDIYTSAKAPKGDVVFRAENIGRKGAFEPISFEVRAGEVLGFSGLMGAGRTEVARCIFGLDRRDSGRMWLDGKEIDVRSPKDALELGICYVSEDRRREGIIPLRSVKENISLADLQQICTNGLIDEAKEDALYEEYREKFRIKATSGNQPIGRLSGGNQQKCCLAKMLACKPRLLILDEPTRGIDVGAKAEIHKLIEQLAKQQIAIIMISSELPEILGTSDRIMVLSEGRLTGEFAAEEATQENIMTCAVQV